MTKYENSLTCVGHISPISLCVCCFHKYLFHEVQRVFIVFCKVYFNKELVEREFFCLTHLKGGSDRWKNTKRQVKYLSQSKGS